MQSEKVEPLFKIYVDFQDSDSKRPSEHGALWDHIGHMDVKPAPDCWSGLVPGIVGGLRKFEEGVLKCGFPKRGGEDRAYLGLSEVLCQDCRHKGHIVKQGTTLSPSPQMSGNS